MTKRRELPEFGRLKGRASRAFGTLEIEFLAGEEGRGPLTAMRVSIRPGDSHPPLFHRRTAEFFVVLSGGMSAVIDGVSRRFRAGDYAYLPPRCVHSFRAGSRGVEVLSLFTPSLAPKTPDIVRAARRH